MNEHERILQQQLERIADEAQLRSGMFKTTLRRANRRRNFTLTSSAAALVAVAIVAALVIPDDRDGREDLTSPEIQPGVVRLLTQPRGLLEIEASKGQLCYRFGMRGVTHTQVVHRESEEVAIDLGGNDQALGVVGCREMDPQALAMVTRDPSSYVVRFENSESGGSETADLRKDGGRPTCYPTPPTSQEYSLHFSQLQGRPGDVIEVWAPTLRDQGGRYSPSDGLELWWNSRTPDGRQPITDGRAMRLFSADTRDRCYFQASFEVPEVVDGTYRLTGFMFDDPRSDGYGIWPGPRFTVVSRDRQTQPDLESCPAGIEGEGLEMVEPYPPRPYFEAFNLWRAKSNHRRGECVVVLAGQQVASDPEGEAGVTVYEPNGYLLIFNDYKHDEDGTAKIEVPLPRPIRVFNANGRGYRSSLVLQSLKDCSVILFNVASRSFHPDPGDAASGPCPAD